MRQYDCTREQDLLDALATSRWPARCDADLVAHVGACPICSDTLTVAEPLVAEADITRAAVRVPSSGIVWWRAQMRARQEAARAASQPIAMVTSLALAATVALVGAATIWIGPGVRSWVASMRALAGHVSTEVQALGSIQAHAPNGLLGWSMLALLLVLGPLALYLAVTSE